MRIKNLPSIESMDGSQDALVIEQTDGSEDKSRKVSPAQIKQYMEAGDFEATGEVKDGHGNILKDMAKSADVDDEIGDLSQTGLTGDSVAAQLETAGEQIADINANLTVKSYVDEGYRTIPANGFATFEITLDDAELGIVSGFALTNSVSCIPMIVMFYQRNKLTFRILNTSSSQQSVKLEARYL